MGNHYDRDDEALPARSRALERQRKLNEAIRAQVRRELQEAPIDLLLGRMRGEPLQGHDASDGMRPVPPGAYHQLAFPSRDGGQFVIEFELTGWGHGADHSMMLQCQILREYTKPAPVVHWQTQRADIALCGAHSAAAQMTRRTKEVTCPRCIEIQRTRKARMEAEAQQAHHYVPHLGSPAMCGVSYGEGKGHSHNLTLSPRKVTCKKCLRFMKLYGHLRPYEET